MEIRRRKTSVINLGKLKVGGNNPIYVQSMTKTGMDKKEFFLNEVNSLQAGRCEIIRVAIPDKRSVDMLAAYIKSGIFRVPVVADIHFSHTLAIKSLEYGADCVRINPGNIGSSERVVKIIEKAREKGAALRIGVNSGSLEEKALKDNKGNIRKSVIESVIKYVRLFENAGFKNFKVSAKSSSVQETIDIYRDLSVRIRYPLHLGLTESGLQFYGSIKSSVAMGILLGEGIGDTIRVSLTGDPLNEVKAGYCMLRSLGLRKTGVNIISCPTCGRTKVDLKKYVEEVSILTENMNKPVDIAVMGCIVNGPGESKESDIGIAFGKSNAAIFSRGKIVKRVKIEKVMDEFNKELKKI